MINKRKRGQDDDVTIHQKKNVSYNTLRVSVGILEGNTAPNILHSSTSIQNRSMFIQIPTEGRLHGIHLV